MVDRTVVWAGEKLIVRWMRFQESYPAQEYHLNDASDEDQARFLSLAKRLAETGRLLNPSHAHFLSAPYDQLFELKPKRSRYFGFFLGTSLYIVHAAPKRPKAKAQQSDYEIAEARRQDFLERLAKKNKGEKKK